MKLHCPLFLLTYSEIYCLFISVFVRFFGLTSLSIKLKQNVIYFVNLYSLLLDIF